MTQPATAEPRFLFVGGDPALDLINTVDWTSRGLENERLEGFEQLTRWAEGAGVIDAATGRRLRRLGETRPRAAAAALTYAIEARGTLRELFGSIARGEPAGPALARFNRLQREAIAGLEIAAVEGAGTGYRWRWRGEESDPRALVWRVLWSAASLLRSDEIGNVRVCDGDDCGWMYVDRSRNGLRRWCQMRTCGTREKTRRRRVSDSPT
ncbi:MAG TPA: ABATE domain-containing protein [Gemmatimonadales bacterium]|nr:ABATE domain-containing protein [Gemmatimonadales bacterium]